jgi:hypothetical protein
MVLEGREREREGNGRGMKLLLDGRNGKEGGQIKRRQD